MRSLVFSSAAIMLIFACMLDTGFLPATFRGKILVQIYFSFSTESELNLAKRFAESFNKHSNGTIFVFVFEEDVCMRHKEYTIDHIYAKSVNLFCEI